MKSLRKSPNLCGGGECVTLDIFAMICFYSLARNDAVMVTLLVYSRWSSNLLKESE